MKRIIELLKKAAERLQMADREIMNAIEFANAVTMEEIKVNYPYLW